MIVEQPYWLRWLILSNGAHTVGVLETILPLYDLQCVEHPEHTRIDVWERVNTVERDKCEQCGGEMRRAMLTKASSVSGDEIHVEVKHGLCHPDGRPRLFTSKEALKRAEKGAGLTNYVRHVGTKGGDRSKHTTRWI